MKFISLLLLAMAQPIYAHEAGGEIGNAKNIHYINQILNFETVYPETWQTYDLDSTVSFSDAPNKTHRATTEATIEANAQTTSRVSVTQETHDEIQTEDALWSYLRISQPSEQWEPIEIDGKHGFHNLHEKIYLLRDPGIITLIQYQNSGESKSEKGVQLIINALRFH